MKALKQALSLLLSSLLVWLPVSTSLHAEEPEAMTFAEYTQPIASAGEAQARESAMKARELPVTNRGAFTTSIAIDVPPGRRGMSPDLAIQYNSGAFRQESAFGAGFSLEVGSIRRSTANGYPQLERVGGDLKYDDDAARAFEGPAGRLVEIDCSELPIQCPPQLVGVDARVFVPEVETEPVRYEYYPDAADGGEWIELLPNGVRRYYGARPTGPASSARARNERGTFAWLLVYENDRFGNFISYAYKGAQWAPQSPKVVQENLVLARVEWGGNEASGVGAPLPFVVTIDYRPDVAGGVDFMNGAVRHAWLATTIVVGDSSPAEYWRYALNVSSSSRTSLQLLTAVTRSAPGDAAGTRRTWSFHYTGDALSWETGGRDLPNGVYVQGSCSGFDSSCLQRAIGYQTFHGSMSPPGLRSAFQLSDLDADGDNEIVYHPAHVKAPAAAVSSVESFSGLSPGTFDEAPTNHFAFPPGLDGATSYSDLVDVDGDGDVDGVHWPVELTRRGDSRLPDFYAALDLCGDETFWNLCGDIDPLPPYGPWASEVDGVLWSGVLGSKSLPRPAGRVMSLGLPRTPSSSGGGFCLEVVTACIGGASNVGQFALPGSPVEVNAPPSNMDLAVGIHRNLTKTGSQHFPNESAFTLEGWPEGVRATVGVVRRLAEGFSGRDAYVATIKRDVYVPFSDVNGDGLQDVVLLKHLYGPSSGRPIVKFVPEVWTASDDGFFREEHSQGAVSSFGRSLKNAFVPGKRTYSEAANQTAILIDVNGDSLPDVVRATPPEKFGVERFECREGHEVWLNEGDRWSPTPLSSLGFKEAWSGASGANEPAPGLDWLVNRGARCGALGYLTPITDDGGGPNRLPSSAMSITDLDADGRPDVVFLGVDKGTPIRKFFRNTRRGYSASTFPSSFPADVFFAMGLPNLRKLPPHADSNVLADLARLIDVDLDGLVDIVVPGIRGNLSARAKWHRNKGSVPDLLSEVRTNGGGRTKVTYLVATSTEARARIITELGDAPAGLVLVESIVRRSGDGDIPETIELAYDHFQRDSRTREPIGFKRVKSKHSPGTVALGSETVVGVAVSVTRTFNMTDEIHGVRYPLRGQVDRLEIEDGNIDLLEIDSNDPPVDGTMAMREETLTRVTEPLGSALRLRAGRSESSECLPGFTGCVAVANESSGYDEFGFATSVVTTDGADSSDVVVSSLSYYHKLAAWNLGLVKSESVYGRTELLTGEKRSMTLSSTQRLYTDAGLLERESRETGNRASCRSQPADVTEYKYDAFGQPTKTIRANREVTTAYGLEQLYPQEVVVSAFGAPPMVERYSHDRRHGLVTKRTDVNEQVWKTQYDSFGRAIETRGPQDVRLSTEAYVDNPSAGVRPTETATIYSSGSESTETRTTKDGLGRVLAVTEGDAVSGFVRKMRSRLDGFGRVVYRHQPATVSGLGQVGVAEDGLANAYRTRYDGFDREVALRTPDHRLTKIRYAPRLIDTINPRGFRTARVLDARGDAMSVTSYDEHDSELATVKYARDGFGRIVRVTDADQLVRRLVYDIGGRLVTTSLPSKGPLIGVSESCWDNDDNLAGRSTVAGREMSIERDGLGRPRAVHGKRTGAPDRNVTYTYDDATTLGRGRLRSRADESGTRTFEYDEFGSMRLADYVASSPVAPGFDANVKYAYDLQGRLKRVDLRGDVPQLGYSLDRDPRGRLLRITDQDDRVVVSQLRYDAHDRVFSVDFPTTRREWTYAPQSEALIALNSFDTSGGASPGVGAASAPPMMTLTYEYDENLNVTLERRTQPLNSQQLHAYDGLDRLVSVLRVGSSGASYEEHYSYTPGGFFRRLTRGPGAGSGSVDYVSGGGTVSPQAVVRLDDSEGPTQSLSYDDDGFATSNGGSVHTYDALGCLVGATAGATAIRRICDDDGHELFRKTVAGTSVQRVVDLFGLAEYRPDANRVVLRFKVNGTALAEETYVAPSAERVRVGAECRVLHTDLRGSVLLTSINDAPPTISQDVEYNAWGATIGGTNPPLHRFLDHEEDALGYYSFGKRTYSPSLRRWLSPDPLVVDDPGVDASARQLDLYAYAANNPVARTDQDGTIAPLIVMGIVGILWGISAGFESDTVVTDAAGEQHGGANLGYPLAGAAAPFAAASMVGGAVATAETIVSMGAALGPMVGVSAGEGAIVAGGAAAATVAATGAASASIATTLQMTGYRGERRTARKPEGTGNPEKASDKVQHHQTGKKTGKDPAASKKEPEPEKPRSGKKEKDRLEREKARQTPADEKPKK